jgi:hypothetical protein
VQIVWETLSQNTQHKKGLVEWLRWESAFKPQYHQKRKEKEHEHNHNVYKIPLNSRIQ